MVVAWANCVKLPLTVTSNHLQLPCSAQVAFGETWVLYDLGVLGSMLICLITYSVYIQSLVDFKPPDTYEVYDSLGPAQAHHLLPKKHNPSAYNGNLSQPSCLLSAGLT